MINAYALWKHSVNSDLESQIKQSRFLTENKGTNEFMISLVAIFSLERERNTMLTQGWWLQYFIMFYLENYRKRRRSGLGLEKCQISPVEHLSNSYIQSLRLLTAPAVAVEQDPATASYQLCPLFSSSSGPFSQPLTDAPVIPHDIPHGTGRGRWAAQSQNESSPHSGINQQ